ncbi:hypothetical protein ACRE_005340 [Hapsidospora chrysogenum ATCC 11550]|uniref:Uncharacterized protein n=1 Tax=Hapsidospora chrysogenum (strain ATCC 11550 / CBS 779.69 / DSM 880 / IAM 14645 / JCM 23072 / IMI 49137) TaxID=857340 RepID=A0A086TGY5_HAPC1|nr:hypothetical protein ACRE_005340 [Hapsidospora chrysogenum ATCC 11550]
MVSEFKHARRRTNSTAASIRNGHARSYSRQVAQAKSSHTSDDFLKPFLSPSFDPAAFLNSNLPPLQRGATANLGQDGGSAASSGTAELSAQAQTLLSQLNAHTTRLSNTLTQLTDDILRSGSRLAYEVELLRGETLSLTETINETLQEDIKKFVPEGVQAEPGAAKKEAPDGQDATSSPADESPEPAYIKQLQTLTLVRERLESVIKTFGDAMEFVFPPSELSVSSSFLSVSAPEPGSQQQSSEEKGQEVLKKLRDEISTILSDPEDPVDGIAKAAQRVEELKELTSVWKGTAEEKGRNKFIESLAKMVEDRHRELMKEMEQAAKAEGKPEGGRPRKSSVSRDSAGTEDTRALPGGFGLLNQLQRLRSGL